MTFSFTKVFSRSDDAKSWRIQDSAHVPIALSREAYYRFLFERDNAHELTVPQKLVVEVTLQNMQKKEYRQKSLPRLPYVIPKLLKSLRDPDSSAKDYVDIIGKDPVMASAVLKLANSVYFNPIRRRIHEIDQAVVKLGITGLRAVLSAAVMQPIINQESAYFSKSGQRIWQHSLNCAVACELIAEHRRVEKFKVYILGLIHDIGMITLLSELSKQFKLNEENVQPSYKAFVPALRKLSPALSYWIARDWEMSKELCDALSEQINLKENENISAFGHVLYQANLSSEIFASIYPQKPQKALAVLSELDLPKNLFDNLGLVSREIS